MGIVGGVDRESYRKISRVRDALHVPRDKFQAEQGRVWPRLLGFVKQHDKCTANILQKIDILSMKPQLTLALFAAKRRFIQNFLVPLLIHLSINISF